MVFVDNDNSSSSSMGLSCITKPVGIVSTQVASQHPAQLWPKVWDSSIDHEFGGLYYLDLHNKLV